MSINASEDSFNDKFAKVDTLVNNSLKLLAKELGSYGFVGTASVVLSAAVTGKDTTRPMSRTTEAVYNFKAR